MGGKHQSNSAAVVEVFKNCQQISSTIVPELYGEEYSQMYTIQSLDEINQDLQDHLEKENSEGK